MKNKPWTLLIVFTLAIFTSFSESLADQWDYKEMMVKNGGSVKGKTYLAKAMPEPRVYHLVLFPNIDMCSEIDTDGEGNRILDDFVTSENGALKDVVVAIEHIDSGKPFNKKPINILSENCKFTPEVNAVRQGEGFKVDNVDAVMHNSQVYQSERGKIILNIPIPSESVSIGAVNFEKDFRIFQMICGMHEFMQTWGYRVQNPYYNISGTDGTYNIDNLPSGDYEITAWHYLMKPRTKKIHIEENSVVDLDFIFDGTEVVRPLYETIKSGRIKKEANVFRERFDKK